MKTRRARVLLPLLLLAVGCARGVAVGTDPGAAYAIEVVNRSGADLEVGFDAGSGVRSLGPVSAGATERFVVVSPNQSSVTIVGTGPGVDVRQSVQLRAGETVRVVLQG